MDHLSSSPVGTLALGDLSLNAFDSPERDCSSVHGNGKLFYYSTSEQLPCSSAEYQSRWSVPAWQGLDSGSYSQLDPSFDMLSPYGHALPFQHDFLPYLPELEFPPSPSDTCSSSSTDFSSPLSYSPRPESLHVICNVPLLAPVPLPYHSPNFLQFDLPDVDEDLSHPPYTQRCPSSKRKRDIDDSANGDRTTQKRRSENITQSIRPGYVSKRHPPVAGKAFRIRQYVARH